MIPHGQELIVILVIILLLFGARKLPELGKSLGQGIKEFKKSTKEIISDDSDESEKKNEKDSSDA